MLAHIKSEADNVRSLTAPPMDRWLTARLDAVCASTQALQGTLRFVEEYAV